MTLRPFIFVFAQKRDVADTANSVWKFPSDFTFVQSGCNLACLYQQYTDHGETVQKLAKYIFAVVMACGYKLF